MNSIFEENATQPSLSDDLRSVFSDELLAMNI